MALNYVGLWENAEMAAPRSNSKLELEHLRINIQPRNELPLAHYILQYATNLLSMVKNDSFQSLTLDQVYALFDDDSMRMQLCSEKGVGIMYVDKEAEEASAALIKQNTIVAYCTSFENEDTQTFNAIQPKLLNNGLLYLIKNKALIPQLGSTFNEALSLHNVDIKQTPIDENYDTYLNTTLEQVLVDDMLLDSFL